LLLRYNSLSEKSGRRKEGRKGDLHSNDLCADEITDPEERTMKAQLCSLRD
jgi:hypothetical protein